ncbi:sugar transporter [Histoplasma capsulatum]|uniref:Sugar transporter n=1 Tax=Ajellomyces capsulatus TaxID=5037 RepID=A0A8A1M7D6_AJECA|nr:sugar transporter [Histoplasma capsulatum]
MPLLVNPFRQQDHSSFPGVVVPLAQAPRHRKFSHSNPNPGDGDKADNVAEKGSSSSLSDRQYSGWTVEAIRAEVESDAATSGRDTAYDRKSKVINLAIQDIGMGKYQWQLFVLCGFGWLADNLSVEFDIDASYVRFTTCSLFVGLCVGAVFWGTASDMIGRRLAFNLTLLITGVFGLAAGGSPTWVGVCSLFACLGLGVGGNLPVDGALFLEFLPFASGNLLTMLSIWWPVGTLVGSMIAWGLIPNFSCDPSAVLCTKENNMGWRYLVITLGGLTFVMFLCRFFLFHLYESPKFLLSRGRQADAVATVHAIAYKNGANTWLTSEILNEIGGYPEEIPAEEQKLSSAEVIKRQLAKFSGQRIAPLFATKKLGFTTVLLWICWATIGMGYPLFNAFLPQYLGNNGETPVSIVYRNYAITAVVGVPGSILACYTVDIPYIGRKGTMAISTALTVVTLFCFTISTDPDVQLACSSLEAFFQNIMYGVLYAYTPEVFPAPNRGTGTGIASCLNRICGLLAPIVAIYGGSANPKAPVYASGGLMLAAFVAMVLLPIETRGRASL